MLVLGMVRFDLLVNGFRFGEFVEKRRLGRLEFFRKRVRALLGRDK